MRIYRLYLLDQDGDVLGAVELVCTDDEQAIAVAAQHPAQNVARRELWQSARLVKTWPMDPVAS